MTKYVKRSAASWPLSIAVVWFAGLAASGIAPFDRVTWAMEIAPTLIVAPLLLAMRRSAPLTPLLYTLILQHGLVLIIGGAYSYARVPAGFWVQDMFDLSRNPYDKLGHFMQGFTPAIAARELLLRRGGMRRGGWLVAVVILACLGISALYEIIEWAAALALGQGAEEFLGTQGYVWDTQSDMFMCGVGAVTALVLLSRWHDRQLARRAHIKVGFITDGAGTRRFLIDASSWTTEKHLWESILAALQAPEWHGENLDALWETVTEAAGCDDTVTLINGTQPPFELVIIGAFKLKPELRQRLASIENLFAEARTEYGLDIAVTVVSGREPWPSLDAE